MHAMLSRGGLAAWLLHRSCTACRRSHALYKQHLQLESGPAHCPSLKQAPCQDSCVWRQDIEQGKKVEAVTISTIHKAKGLEWDVVFLHQCNKGQLPMEFRPADDKVPKPAAPRDAPFRPPDHSVSVWTLRMPARSGRAAGHPTAA